MATPEAPADVWCRHCDQPSVETVNGEAYCRKHATDQLCRLARASAVRKGK
jgi:hypothetical protein